MPFGPWKRVGTTWLQVVGEISASQVLRGRIVLGQWSGWGHGENETIAREDLPVLKPRSFEEFAVQGRCDDIEVFRGGIACSDSKGLSLREGMVVSG